MSFYLVLIAFNMNTSVEKKITELFPEPSEEDTYMMWCHTLNVEEEEKVRNTYNKIEQPKGEAKAILQKLTNYRLQFSVLVFWGDGKETRQFLFTRDLSSDTPKIYATYYSTTEIAPKILLETPLFHIGEKESCMTIGEYINSFK